MHFQGLSVAKNCLNYEIVPLRLIIFYDAFLVSQDHASDLQTIVRSLIW